MADLTLLDPAFLPKVNAWASAVAQAGLYARITVTYRDAADQNQCEQEGLSNAGAGQSPHNCVDSQGNPAARAIDFACFTADGAYITDGTNPAYTAAGQIGESLGLVWGARWSKPDYDHLEMPDWRTA